MVEGPHSTSSLRSLDGFLLVLWTCLICLNLPNSFLFCCGQCFVPADSANRLSDLRTDFKNKPENSTVTISYDFCLKKHIFKMELELFYGETTDHVLHWSPTSLFMHCKSASRLFLLFYLLLQHKRISINSHFFSVYLYALTHYNCQGF